MISKESDLGVISSFMRRMQTQRLPRVMAIKASLEKGNSLSDYDLAFLDQVLRDVRSIQPMITRNPEYQNLTVRLISLYSGISRQALENERGHS